MSFFNKFIAMNPTVDENNGRGWTAPARPPKKRPMTAAEAAAAKKAAKEAQERLRLQKEVDQLRKRIAQLETTAEAVVQEAEASMPKATALGQLGIELEMERLLAALEADMSATETRLARFLEEVNPILGVPNFWAVN